MADLTPQTTACTHPQASVVAGPRIPRVYGTGPTVLCNNCGAWRAAWPEPWGPWRPADTLAEAMEPDDDR